MTHHSPFIPKLSVLLTLLAALLVAAGLASAQSHQFTAYNAGTVASGTTGSSQSFATGSLSGTYLFYSVTANYVGSGGSPAFSNTMQLELNNGAGTIYKAGSRADQGQLENSNATTLTWTGVMLAPYNGGGNLAARFFDEFATGGSFTSSITNVRVTIFEATPPHNFAAYNAGTVTSGTTGSSQSLPTGSLSGTYIYYTVTADFVGTGGTSAAWSNTMQLELNNGAGTIYKAGSRADQGQLENSNATTLSWTGIMLAPYSGGGNLTARFFDEFNTGGPFTSSVTNVRVSILEGQPPYNFAAYSAGNITSGNAGSSQSLPTSGLSGDFLFYTVSANFVGTGGASAAFSNTMQLELNNSAGLIYKPGSTADQGALSNSGATTLSWTGIMNSAYVGGGNLAARFFDEFTTGGTYNSSVTNVQITIFSLTLEPEININDGTSPSASNIASGGSAANFGSFVAPGSAGTTRTFNIDNATGTGNLTISSITTIGGNAADFTVGTLTPASPIASGNSSNFTVTFTPSAAGVRTTTLRVISNDANESTYNITLNGSGTKATPTVVITGQSPNPSNPGQGYSVTWTVTGINGGPAPSGTVTVNDGGGNNTGAIALPTTTGTITTLLPGSKTLTASYSGDANYNATTGTASHTVNSPPTTTADTIIRFPTQGIKVTAAILLSNDSDGGAAPNTLTAVTASDSGATVSLDNGVIFYNPNGVATADSFTYTIQNGNGLTAQGTVNVSIVNDTAPTPNITSFQLTGIGPTLSATIGFAAIPGRTYRIQTSPDMLTWTDTGTSVTADAFGRVNFTDPPPAPATRFYRTLSQ